MQLFYMQDSRGYVGNCVLWWADRNEAFFDDDEDMDDEAGHKRRAREAAISLVNDIRANRGLPAAV